MGNFISCALITSPQLKTPKSARVILPSGEIRQFRRPAKAADLMLDSPNHFAVNTNSLAIGRRFSPLSADDDVQLGNLYVMIPMRRLNSIVTAADAAVFLMAANAAPRRIAAVGISPEAGDDSSGNGRLRLSLDEEAATEFKHRLAICRSKRPGLDTIIEETVFAR